MKLHDNNALFKTIITAAAINYNILPIQIEKDYYITMIIAEAMRRIPGLMFKGGTSLAKCYKVINRFSEDIDLTLSNEYFSRSNKIYAIHELVNICDDLGLNITNKEHILSYTHGKYSRFTIEFEPVSKSDEKPSIIMEMVYIQKTFPYEIGSMNSYIGEHLIHSKEIDNLNEYDLEEFPVRLQSLERTLIDKVFAICDYYISGNYRRNSRHIYDIYKLLDRIDITTPDMKELVQKVREVRKSNEKSYSAQDGVDVPQILREILWNHSFENDYNTVTKDLLYENIGYDEAINGIYAVLESEIFEVPQSGREKSLK